jgi:hypothetical protein
MAGSAKLPANQERQMRDLEAKLERLRCEASECEMIGNLATDKPKRDLFRKLATDLRAMARDIEAMIAIRSRANDDAA